MEIQDITDKPELIKNLILNHEPPGLFIERAGKMWVAYDNSGSELFDEEFETEEAARLWLEHPEATPEDVKAMLNIEQVGNSEQLEVKRE